MPTISQLASDTVPNDNDLLVTVDVNAGTTKNITREDFFTGAPLPDGTILTRAAITAALGAGVTPTLTSTTTGMVTAQKLELTRAAVQQGNLTLSGGDIIVGAGISLIEVSAQVYLQTPLTAGSTVRVAVVNSTKGEVIVRTLSRPGGEFSMVATPPALAGVSEGDVIRLTVSGAAGSTGVEIGNNTFDTFLSVRAV